MELIVYITSFILGMSVILIMIILYKRRGKYFQDYSLPKEEFLSVLKLGEIEGMIDDLTEVIIVADHIEKPENTLLASVKTNFLRGVKYKFLISKSNFENEREKYYLFFKAIANINDLQTQLSIESLLFDWEEYPYIFYRTQEKGITKTFAYKGTELNEGIADSYKLIEPEAAQTIARIVNKSSISERQLLFKSEEFDTKIFPLGKAV